MHTNYAQLARALDLVEARVAARAFARCDDLVRVIELALESYLESTLRHPHVACEVSTELLWRHFSALRDAIAERDPDKACGAAVDLRAELLAHHRAHQGYGRGASAH